MLQRRDERLLKYTCITRAQHYDMTANLGEPSRESPEPEEGVVETSMGNLNSGAIGMNSPLMCDAGW